MCENKLNVLGPKRGPCEIIGKSLIIIIIIIIIVIIILFVGTLTYLKSGTFALIVSFNIYYNK
jgi:hypothetical protein